VGTLGKEGSNPLIFDGRPKSWPTFKKALYQSLDKKGYDWVVEGGDAFCAMLQAASAKAAKCTTTSVKGTVSTNVADYNAKDLLKIFADASVTTSIELELHANRKTVLGAHLANHDKLGMTKEDPDAKHLMLVKEDLSKFLNSATGDQRRRKTFYKIDTELDRKNDVFSTPEL
jgi:hypothetical protein